MDIYKDYPSTLTSPVREATPVPAGNEQVFSNTTRALYVGATGDVAVEMASGQTVTFEGVQGGSLLPLRVARVLGTGTTATGIVGLW